MTIKEIEERSGLPRANIRYYESEGLLRPTRAANGYRDYSEEDLTTLRKVKLLREVGCSLEEVASLQAGEIDLSAVLTRRQAALEKEAAVLERAKTLCAALQADKATYATLNPERYLSPTPIIPWEPLPPSPPHYPWRRYFARGLDYLLASTLVQFLRALLFNVSNLNPDIGSRLLVALLSLGVVLIAEPLMLHRWGTTPGKWVFRLRLCQEDGTPLSYEDAFGRTINVLLAGCGLRIPLVSTVTGILSFYRDSKDIPQPWAVEGEVFEDTKPGKDFHAIRVVGLYALFFILAVSLLTLGEMRVATLPYPHPTTVSQFAANYNKIVRYNDQVGVVPLLNTDDGLPYDPSDDIYYTYIEPYRYSFEFADPNAPFTSELTAVKLDIDLFSQNSVRYPGTEMAYALQALEGNSALFLNPNSNLYKRCRCLRLRDPEGLKTLPEAYWHAYLDYSVSGGRLQEWFDSYAFLPDQKEKFDPDLSRYVSYSTSQHVQLTFRLRRK